MCERGTRHAGAAQRRLVGRAMQRQKNTTARTVRQSKRNPLWAGMRLDQNVLPFREQSWWPAAQAGKIGEGELASRGLDRAAGLRNPRVFSYQEGQAIRRLNGNAEPRCNKLQCSYLGLNSEAVGRSQKRRGVGGSAEAFPWPAPAVGERRSKSLERAWKWANEAPVPGKPACPMPWTQRACSVGWSHLAGS